MLPRVKPRWIVCEDGDEYLERFTRFLAGEFDFVAAADAGALLEALGPGADGVILDLDFRRAPAHRRLGEAETEGILIARMLRERGLDLPVLLFADIDDAARVAQLEQSLAPLAIVPSHEGLLQTAARLRR